MHHHRFHANTPKEADIIQSVKNLILFDSIDHTKTKTNLIQLFFFRLDEILSPKFQSGFTDNGTLNVHSAAAH